LRLYYTGKTYVGWLTLVSFAFTYNAWVIPLRLIFPYQTKENLYKWIIADAMADFVYVFDIVAIKSHVKFISNGFWVKEPSETRKAYVEKLQFKVELHTFFCIFHF